MKQGSYGIKEVADVKFYPLADASGNQNNFPFIFASGVLQEDLLPQPQYIYYLKL